MLPYLAELWNVDQTSQVFQVRAFVVESPQVEMLRIVSRTQGIENFRRLEFYGDVSQSILRYLSLRALTSVHGSHHTRDESVDTVTLLDQRDQCRYTAFIVVRASEMRKDELLERFNLILKSHQIANRFVTAAETQRICQLSILPVELAHTPRWDHRYSSD